MVSEVAKTSYLSSAIWSPLYTTMIILILGSHMVAVRLANITLSIIITEEQMDDASERYHFNNIEPNDITRVIAGYAWTLVSNKFRAQNWIDFTVFLGYSFCIVAFDNWCPLRLCRRGYWLTPFAMIFAAWPRSKAEPKGCMSSSSSCGAVRPDLLYEFSSSPDPHYWPGVRQR